ncbi:TonB-dependent receptor domain-containing protein [Thalassotalea sp. PLHSN55]|uniref:TonB-dependent receptor domain-containing protein n=1 Tax=Thalassotalea sp. PLHSN55 TaxID=3435888 RepID=UPI003F85DC62
MSFIQKNNRGFLILSCLLILHRWRHLFEIEALLVQKLSVYRFWLLCIASSISMQVSANEVIYFDIKKQRADKALIAFGQQANQTILFSFGEVKQFQANELKGHYSAESGLKKLLAVTGLSVVVHESGHLGIQPQKHDGTITMNNKKTALATLIPLLVGTASQTALAQETPAASEESIEKISIVGSRVAGRSADDLPVPVDILSAEALANTGQTEVGRMLQAIAPSFNFSTSAISDGTDALRPATLRGLGPDQTLVLINGKRRHQASLIHINTSVGRGTAGTDMNAIPAAAIKRIEVLRDGAAAQYGSDAIAGVINIVLNDDDEDGKVALSYGEYSEGDGETTNLDISKGFALGEEGYLNTTLNIRDRSPTNRAGLHGSCQFSGCTELANGDMLLGDPREATAPRTTFRIGDADSKQVALTINAGYELGDGELYSFITYSKRDNQSAAFFRHNNNSGGNAQLQDGDATIPEGFLPKINSDIRDVSYNVGYQVEFSNDSSLDLSYTYGSNTIDYTTSDTINSSFANDLRYGGSGLTADEIRSTIPREAYAYGLELALQTLNLDYTKEFDNFSFAMGAEIRTDEYKVTPGEEYSYRDYDTVDGESLYVDDRSAGSQGFGGIGPVSEVDETRDVISFYLDAETELTEDLIVSGAVRYDDYEGFGDSTNFKLAANWSITDDFALRGAMSTGFRAPSMQQLYFNNISTQFVTNPDDPTGDQIAVQIGTFRNDSTLAQAIGIPELKEEESTNFSIGAVIKPADDINVTIDFYTIDIDDRIVISNKLGDGLSTALDAALKAAGAGAGQFFLNGADTETKGVDIIATWNTEVLNGDLDLTFAANFTETDVVDLFAPQDSGLGDIDPSIIFSEQDISIIEEWQPQDRMSLSGLYQTGDFTVNLAFNRYGEYTITDGGRQTYGAEVLTDLRVKYQLNDNLSFNIGANNLFDVMPDKNEIGNSRTGTIVDADGNVIVSSPGVFTYSRRSAPFGFNGAYYYAGAEFTF